MRNVFAVLLLLGSSSAFAEGGSRAPSSTLNKLMTSSRAEFERAVQAECSQVSEDYRDLMLRLGTLQIQSVSSARIEIEGWAQLTGKKTEAFSKRSKEPLESEKVWAAAETPEVPGKPSALAVYFAVTMGFKALIGVGIAGVIIGFQGLVMLAVIPSLFVATATGAYFAGSWLSGPLSGNLDAATFESYRIEKTELGHVLKIDTGVTSETSESEVIRLLGERMQKDQKLFRDAHAALRRGFDRVMKQEESWIDFSRRGARRVAEEEARDQANLYDLEFRYYRALFQLAGAQCSRLQFQGGRDPGSIRTFPPAFSKKDRLEKRRWLLPKL